MPRINTHIKITIHLLLWILLYLLRYIFLRDSPIEFNFLTEFAITAIYAVVFYFNYYFLMPFLFENKVFKYMAFSIILLFSTLFLKYTLNNKRFENSHFEKMNQLKMPTFDESIFMSKPNDRMPKPKGVMSHWIFFDSYGLILFFVLSFSMRFIQKWQDDERNKSEMEKEKVKTELNFLKQQINPHFLFNSLNSIYSLSISKSDVTTSSILKLSSILRYMLYESEDSLVSLKDEISTIQDYIDLQRLRLTNKVSLKLQIAGNSNSYKIAPFLLIPLIENAFKYGVDNVNESFINIGLYIKDSQLTMEVSNKKVSDTVKYSKNSGIGLKNIKRRLELLYPNEYTFKITNLEYVFTINLELQLRS